MSVKDKLTVTADPQGAVPKAGPSTLVAVPTSALLAVWAAVQAIVAGEVTQGVIVTAIPALVIVVAWIFSRGAQAYAMLRDRPSAAVFENVTHEVDEGPLVNETIARLSRQVAELTKQTYGNNVNVADRPGQDAPKQPVMAGEEVLWPRDHGADDPYGDSPGDEANGDVDSFRTDERDELEAVAPDGPGGYYRQPEDPAGLDDEPIDLGPVDPEDEKRDLHDTVRMDDGADVPLEVAQKEAGQHE